MNGHSCDLLHDWSMATEICESKPMNRFYLKNRFVRYSLITIGVIVVLNLFGGFLLDWRGFLEGALTSIAFSGITIIVGLFFVDRLIEYRQEQQWARVRLLTYRSLAAHLCDMASMTMIAFPYGDHRPAGRILEGRNEPREVAVAGFECLTDGLRNLTDSQSRTQSLSDMAVEFYEMVRWDLSQIQTVLTPRLLESATDQKLIDALMVLDHAHRALYSAILAHKLAITQSAYYHIPDLIAAAGHLYREMRSQWERAEHDLAKDNGLADGRNMRLKSEAEDIGVLTISVKDKPGAHLPRHTGSTGSLWTQE